VAAVRRYLRYPLTYGHVSELLTERGLAVDASCIWRWVQAYAPELSQRCRQHLKPVNKSYRVDETYIKVCRAHYPDGSDQVPVGCSLSAIPHRVTPFPCSLPRFEGGSASICTERFGFLSSTGVPVTAWTLRYFRGLLKLHSCYGLQSCSPTIRGLYREASPGPVSRPVRSQANKSYRQLLVRVLPPLVIRAFEAHFKNLRFLMIANTNL
jgi:hypothetical protein